MGEKAIELLEGAGDTHVHVSPSLVPDRKSDIWGLVEACERRRMRFAVVKWHHGDSYSSARVVNQRHGGPLELYGGLVLNRPAGGLNPYAVDSAVTLGAKIVWLPTLDAEGHARAIGELGGFPFQTVRRSKLPSEGLLIVDEDGTLKEEMREILELLDGTETVLASGHVTIEEIVRLHEYIERERLAVNLLVNHVDFSVPNLAAHDIAALASPRVWFEIAYFTISALGHSSIAAVKGLIEANPAAQFVLASDSGQQRNPIAPEAMLLLIDGLLDAGVSVERLEVMLHRNASRLLMLE